MSRRRINQWIQRIRNYRRERQFIASLKRLGVDFTCPKPDDRPETWVKTVLEQAAWLSDSEYSSRLLKTQAQINALYSQINPHFLYNTLELIRSQALDRGVGEIAEMAEILANMFRYNISHPKKLATLSQEMENVKNYFLIQQYRFQDRFTLEELFDQEDEALMNCLIPRLSLQPIVENAVYHGLEQKPGKGTVQIRIFLTDERMVIRIADNGVGMSPDTAGRLRAALRQGVPYAGDGQDRRGIAIGNINQRLKLYYGEEYGLSFSSVEKSGTIVEMTVPRQYEADYFPAGYLPSKQAKQNSSPP